MLNKVGKSRLTLDLRMLLVVVFFLDHNDCDNYWMKVCKNAKIGGGTPCQWQIRYIAIKFVSDLNHFK